MQAGNNLGDSLSEVDLLNYHTKGHRGPHMEVAPCGGTIIIHAIDGLPYRGVDQLADHESHKLRVTGSIPVSATNRVASTLDQKSGKPHIGELQLCFAVDEVEPSEVSTSAVGLCSMEELTAVTTEAIETT